MSDGMREELKHIYLFGPSTDNARLDAYMAWARKWAGRPSKDQCMAVISKWWIKLGIPRDVCDPVISDLAESMASLYPTPSPRVSREQVEKTLISHIESIGTCSCNKYGRTCNGLLNDLCSLFGIPEERPKECKCYPERRPGLAMSVSKLVPPICSKCDLEIKP